MAGVVVNNHVKMEWLKEQWLQAKSGSRQIFCCAAKTYESEVKGTVDVFFRPNTAFLWISDPHTEDEDMWSSAELFGNLKKDFDSTFPQGYDEYVPIIDSGEEECMMDVLEEYGIVDAKADIEARLKDLEYYGREEELEL